MKRAPFFFIVVLVSIGIILLNSLNSLKYLTCEDPNNIVVTIDELTETEITLTITTLSSAETFSDYVYHIEDNTLYVGAKFALNLFTDSPRGSYTFTIETTEQIETVILKGGMEETSIPIE